MAPTRLKTSQTGLLHSKMPVNDFYFGAYELLNAIENPRPGGKGPGTRFSKLPVITGPVKLFCFPFQMGVSEDLKTVQLRYQLEKRN